MTHIRYVAAACQTDLANPLGRAAMNANTDRIVALIDQGRSAHGAPVLEIH
jgi:hypothetical protein